MPITRSMGREPRQVVDGRTAPPKKAMAQDAPPHLSRMSQGRVEADEPPQFTINLSLPPEQRYLEVCTALQDEITNLTSLFDQVVGGMLHFIDIKWVHRLCRLLLRGVYEREENAELHGISNATGVSMYLLVCFNVLLDLFMGCSSGGAAVRDGDGGAWKMVHFRTLDWDMPALRRIVVQLDFVLESEGPVVASSITYAGFVGVLTGVRTEFSVSLNFRPNRIDNGQFWPDVKYAWHLLCVLLGWRPSIASSLRRFLLPKRTNKYATNWIYLQSSDMVREVCGGSRQKGKMTRAMRSTACYLCFSNSTETTVIEKDRVSAIARTSSDFVVITNNDLEDHSAGTGASKTAATINSNEAAVSTALEEIIHEAKDRSQCAEHNWSNMLVARKKALDLKPAQPTQKRERALLVVDDVIHLVQRYPTTNEMTHFACVMDPKVGRVVWCRRWMKPTSAKWIRAQMSETWNVIESFHGTQSVQTTEVNDTFTRPGLDGTQIAL